MTGWAILKARRTQTSKLTHGLTEAFGTASVAISAIMTVGSGGNGQVLGVASQAVAWMCMAGDSRGASDFVVRAKITRWRTVAIAVAAEVVVSGVGVALVVARVGVSRTAQPVVVMVLLSDGGGFVDADRAATVDRIVRIVLVQCSCCSAVDIESDRSSND